MSMKESLGVAIFRVDGNSDIGLGHVMRCLSIADSFKKIDYDILFILSDHSVERIVEGKGYNTIVINGAYDDLDHELEKWDQLKIYDLYKYRTGFVIIDSYYVTDSYLCNIKRMLAKEMRGRSYVVFIDDLLAFPYPVDYLINYNLFAKYENYDQLYNGNPPHMLLGAEYVPLRSMFCGIPKRKQNYKVANILISTGGADPDHLTIRLINAIADEKNDEDSLYDNSSYYTYHFLIGALNEDCEQIRRISKTKKNIVLHENVSDMRSLISGMDICVSAAGSTLYEICACGVPLITYTLAENQIKGAEIFEKLELAVNLGDLSKSKNPIDMIINAINELSDQYDRRVSMGVCMQNTIDGYGADRIVNGTVNRQND